MILHDTVRLVWYVPVVPPQEDSHGNAITTPKVATVPAEVIALDTDATVSAGMELVITRYRVVFAATVDLPADPGAVKFLWKEVAYAVDGSIERHTIRGRLHHYEAIIKRVTGG